MKNPFYIYRASEPTQHDTAEQYTICKVDCGDRGLDIYYQINKNEDTPTWVFIQNVSSTATDKEIENHIQERFGNLKT